MASPDNNLRFMDNLGLISSGKKELVDKNFNNIIQGKKIDFGDDNIFNENDQNKNQNSQNNIINNQNINCKQNISYSNKKIINRAYISVHPIHLNNNISSKIKCTCSKTGCMKKYCACFANGVPCDGCDCKNCENLGNEIEKKNISNNRK